MLGTTESAGIGRRLFFFPATGAVMQRTFLFLATLVATSVVSSLGCRSCDSCYDYSPPVANCGCGSCGTQRAGSASGGYVQEGYATGDYVTEGTPQQVISQ
jgi:hypothetical protein